MTAMRFTRLMTGLPVTAALGLALATAAVVAPTTARAGDDDTPGVPIDIQVLRNILTGIGLQDPNAPTIDYQERSPLVIPPDNALPPPVKPGAAVANNPNWPKDPDVVRAKLARERDKDRDSWDEMLHERNPLRPDEINPKGVRSRTAQRDSGPQEDPYTSGQGYFRLTPSELGYKGGLFSNIFGSKNEDETAKFTGEPTRTSLTDPPPGYQTPSPDQPYGVGKDKSRPKADNSYITRGEIQ